MYSNNYQPTFDLNSHLSSDLEFDRCLNTNYSQERNDSIDYSRRPSYFTGLLGNNNNNNSSEASYSDQEQQTPSPFNSYEDYQYHHPLDNSQTKRRLSTLVELPNYQASPMGYHSGWINPSSSDHSPQRCHSSPMIYANPAVDMYSPQTYLSYPTNPYPLVDNVILSSLPHAPVDGIYRERASSSSSSSSDSALSVSPPPSRRASKINLKSPLKPTRSRGRRVSNSPSIAGQKVFTCKQDNCGKVFKRSEHLKRHIRSIHTMEKRK